MYQIKKILPDIKRNLAIDLPCFSVGCFFRAEKYKADGTITYQGPWFSNTVLNVGLDGLRLDYNLALSRDDSLIYYLNVGTGTSEPTISQTGLDNFLASTGSNYEGLTENSSVGDEAAGDPAWTSLQQTKSFSIGSCTGNLTELGLSRSSNSSYFNRQLFRDELGDPTVIPVQDDEGLRITIKVILYAPMAINETSTGTITIDGTSVGYTIEQWNGGWLTDERIAPGCIGQGSADVYIATADGGWISPSSRSVNTYSSGDYYREEVAIWDPGTFVGDWKRIRTDMKNTRSPSNSSGMLFLITLDTAQTVVDTEEVTLTFRRSWGRV